MCMLCYFAAAVRFCLFSLLFISTFVNCFDAVVIILRLSSVILCAYFHSFSLFYSHRQTDRQTDEQRVWQRNACTEENSVRVQRAESKKREQINCIHLFIRFGRLFIDIIVVHSVPFRSVLVVCVVAIATLYHSPQNKQINQN